MTVNINNLIVAVPVATSATNPVALEITGAEALARYPSFVRELSNGSIQLSAPTKGASRKAPAELGASGQSRITGLLVAQMTIGIARR